MASLSELAGVSLSLNVVALCLTLVGMGGMDAVLHGIAACALLALGGTANDWVVSTYGYLTSLMALGFWVAQGPSRVAVMALSRGALGTALAWYTGAATQPSARFVAAHAAAAAVAYGASLTPAGAEALEALRAQWVIAAPVASPRGWWAAYG